MDQLLSAITPYLPNSFTTLLFWLIALDMLSGLLKAIKYRRLSSEFSTAGVTRKAGMLLIVMTAHLLEYVVGRVLPSGAGMPIGHTTALYYCVSELLSLFENGKTLGLPIPDFLWSYFKKATDSAGMSLPDPRPGLLDQATELLQQRDSYPLPSPAAPPPAPSEQPAIAPQSLADRRR